MELHRLIQVLLGEVPFEGAKGLSITDEMRVTIGAQAGVLLLGRDLREIPRVRSVIVYPGAYRADERIHTAEGAWIDSSEVRTGEAWSHGVLLFAWDEVRHDATHIDDGENVVFHEMAHILDEETGDSDGVPLQRDAASAEAWITAFGGAFRELELAVRRGHETLLDPYAAESPAEFFAVCTETFLERPEPFRAAYPELYRQLRDYVHLDPVAFAPRLRGRKRSTN